MNDAHVKGIGLFLILVCSFFGCNRGVSLQNGNAATVDQILRVRFSRNGATKPLVSNNALEFCDETLCL